MTVSLFSPDDVGYDRYEEGKTTLFKEVPMSDFVWAEKPLDMLGSITSITFPDPGSDSILKHPLTTEEVKLKPLFVLQSGCLCS
jgi:hypothetical protein